jgi:hypothetical protein
MRKHLAILLLCVGGWQVTLLAQTTDHGGNLSACKEGWSPCLAA